MICVKLHTLKQTYRQTIVTRRSSKSQTQWHVGIDIFNLWNIDRICKKVAKTSLDYCSDYSSHQEFLQPEEKASKSSIYEVITTLLDLTVTSDEFGNIKRTESLLVCFSAM